MNAQEKADQAAGELARAVAEMAAGQGAVRHQDIEMYVPLRISGYGQDLLWTWDWFWRPKTAAEDTAGPG